MSSSNSAVLTENIPPPPASTPDAPAGSRRPTALLSRKHRWISALLLTVAVLAISRWSVGSASFPKALHVPVGRWVEDFQTWFTTTFSWLYDPLVTAVTNGFLWLTYWLDSTPDTTLAVLLVCLVFAAGGVRLAVLATVTIVWVVAVGVWTDTLQTLAFVLLSVVLSCAIGLVVGVVAASNKKLDSLIRVALDAMQAMPSFAYLVPAVVVFGAGNTASLVVTIIWSAPPMARMTAVGLRGVSVDSVEVARSYGATRWQILRGVTLPTARPSIAAGVNQTILFAVSMATITAMIGGAGLGQPVWSGLSRLEFGQALEPGIALVLLAVILDRCSQRFTATRTPRSAPAGRPGPAGRITAFARTHPRSAAALVVSAATAVIVGVIPALRFGDFTKPFFSISLRQPVATVVDWVTQHFATPLDAVVNTIQTYGLNPLGDLLTWLPWPAVLIGVFAAGWFALGRFGAVLATAGTAFIGMLGMWKPAIDTIAVVGVAVVLALAIGFPLGLLMSRSDRFKSLLRPVLDVMQTLPIFLFVIPTVILLGAGPVAGTLATTLFAVPVLIRLTDLALRGADVETVEAATSMGASSRQILFGVRVPLGLPTLMVGVNQTILLALSMAVVSAFIGTPGLGERVLSAVNYAQLGLGAEAGLAMLMIALVVDRVCGGASRKAAAARNLAAS